MLKIALYGLGISLAMDKITPQGIRQLEQIVAAMEKCAEEIPADLAEYQTLNENFHNCLMDIAGNERLKKTCSMLHKQVKRFSYKSLSDKEHLLSSVSSHRRILEAIVNRDQTLAERLNREHILEGMVVLQRVIGVEEGSSRAMGGPSNMSRTKENE
jgi:DNA-binding GntR family transcriptional regulator